MKIYEQLKSPVKRFQVDNFSVKWVEAQI